MARDHRKLRVFHLAHELTIAIYKDTRNFPRDEWFGLRQQLRRAAVSVAANLVEGSARRGGAEYCHFINIARASAAEVLYLTGLVTELGYVPSDIGQRLEEQCEAIIPRLEMLLQRIEADERASKAQSRKPRAQSLEPIDQP
jgi:four helix bundle protein